MPIILIPSRTTMDEMATKRVLTHSRTDGGGGAHGNEVCTQFSE